MISNLLTAMLNNMFVLLSIVQFVAAQPKLKTDDGNVMFEVPDQRNVIVIQGEENNVIELKNTGSTIDAVNLGYKIGNDMKDYVEGIGKDLKDTLAALNNEQRNNDKFFAIQQDMKNFTLIAENLKLETSQKADMQDVNKLKSDAAIVDESLKEIIANMNTQNKTVERFIACAEDGKVLGSDKKCVSLDPVLKRADNYCTSTTAGTTRWVAEAATLQVCASDGKWYNVVGDQPLTSPTNPGESCFDIQSKNPSARSGMYYLKTTQGDNKYMRVYCLMKDRDWHEGGGWMLVLANDGGQDFHTLSYQATSFRIKDYRWARANYWNTFPKGNPKSDLGLDGSNTHAVGVSPHAPYAFSKAKQIMYTDEAFQPFLAANFLDSGNGAKYWNSIHQGSTQYVKVRYFGPNVMSDVRGRDVNIEVNNGFHWGHRGGSSDVCSRCGSCHLCWEDIRDPFYDSPFAGAHCNSDITPPYCPVYGRYESWFSMRHGGRYRSPGDRMKMFKFVRW